MDRYDIERMNDHEDKAVCMDGRVDRAVRDDDGGSDETPARLSFRISPISSSEKPSTCALRMNCSSSTIDSAYRR